MTRKIVGAFLVLLLLASVAWTGSYLYRKSSKPPHVYPTVKPAVGDVVKKTVATGSVRPRQEVAVKPQVSGIVEKLFVEPGQAVARGDSIAKVDIVPNLVSLNEANSRVRRARIAVADAERELERNRGLRQDGVISLQTLQQLEVAADRAREELVAAIDHAELVRKGATARDAEDSNTLVKATATGMVLEVPVEPGDSVIEANTFNDGTTIATIADMDELIFKGKVDESEVAKLKPGMELVLTIGAIEGKTFKATLEHIAPKGVEENGAIQFEIRAALAPEKDAFIRAGLSANADIVLDRRQQVLTLDESCLQFEGGKAYVEVETAPQVFERRPIETGLSDGLRIEVVSGLTAGDSVKDAAKGAS
jgi:HlyD family secretion protein